MFIIIPNQRVSFLVILSTVASSFFKIQR
jgi:hypothetical protein